MVQVPVHLCTKRKEDKELLGGNAAPRQGRTAAPSSVLIASPLPLTKDISDLSGSYLNGNTTPRRAKGSHCGIPRDIYSTCDQSAGSYHGPWRHAKILSTPPPIHGSCSWQQSVTMMVHNNVTATTIIMVERTGVIEVVQEKRVDMEKLPRSDHHHHQHRHYHHRPIAEADAAVVKNNYGHRVPVIILLMDPKRKMFELMQLWVDTLTDSVTNVLHTVQKRLSDKWRQDYDGLFQCRGNQFSQLIHILNVAKYDLQCYEVLVAKPWSMSAKSTIEYANEVLRHMKMLGVLSPSTREDNSQFKFTRSRVDDTPLTLTAEAKRRIYNPGGIMDDYHACQFLTFSPPFESAPRAKVQIGSVELDDGCSSVLSTHGCDSQHGASAEKHLISSYQTESKTELPSSILSPLHQPTSRASTSRTKKSTTMKQPNSIIVATNKTGEHGECSVSLSRTDFKRKETIRQSPRQHNVLPWNLKRFLGSPMINFRSPDFQPALSDDTNVRASPGSSSSSGWPWQIHRKVISSRKNDIEQVEEQSIVSDSAPLLQHQQHHHDDYYYQQHQ